MKVNITFLFLLICIGFVQAQTIDLNEAGVTQMQELNLQQRQSTPYFDSAKRVRPFSLNSQITNHQNIGIGNQINLSLFEDIIHPATVVRKATDINGVVSLTLKLKDFNYSYAYIAISPDSYLITVDIPEKKEKYSSLSSINQTQRYMIQLDEMEYQNAGCGLDDVIGNTGLGGINDIPQIPEGLTNQPIDTEGRPGNINLDGSCIDMPDINDPATITIMFVYTTEAQNWSDSNNGGINNSIAVTMAHANQVSVNNNLGITFELVYSGLANYTQETIGADWVNLQTDGNGKLDEVNELRQNNNADLVAILNYYASGGTAGIANLLTSKYGNNRAVFSATRVNFAVNSNTFIHEIGHNLGAMHNPYQGSDPGPTNWENWTENTYSAGWRWEGSDGNYYADLMSYNSGSEYENGIFTSHIPYFSDPNHTHLGGVAGDPVLGDNARTLKEIKHYIARYKETIEYCNAGTAALFNTTNLYINNVSMGDINNASGASSAYYGDFTALATCIFPGDTQTLDISVVNANVSRPIKVWIDWNDDKEFDPETELIYYSTSGSATHSVDVTAPLGVSYGNKRLRIRTYSLITEPIVDGPCGYTGIGELEDYTINLEAPVACTEAAIPQNLLTGTLTSNTAYISWDTLEGIDHYELRYREIGASEWETISPIWYPYHTIGDLIFETEYEAQVRSVCSSNSGNYSSSINFTTSGYCAAGSNNATFERISNVTFIDINNNSTSTDGYENFSDITTDAEQGKSYTFTASTGGPSYSTDQVIVWIDFNQNGDFSDPGEQVLITATGFSPWLGTINIPEDALLGETRMRIRLHDTSFSPNSTPCGNSGFGQVEDYTLNIIPLVVCEEAATPLNLMVSDVTNDQAILSWDAVPGTTYDVRYREIGTTEWNEISDLSERTVTLVSLIFETNYEAQVRSICNDESSAYSSSLEFTTIGHCPTLYGTFINAFITRVRLGDIDNSSGITGYSDFTAISTDLVQNNSYEITINNGAHDYNRAYAVWIDYNKNGVFDEPEERVWSQTATNAPEVSGQFTIPETTVIGDVVMRVAVRFTNNTSLLPSPCFVNTAASGEAEDYTIVLTDNALTIDSFKFGNGFDVFPNPMKDVFYISTQNIQGDNVEVTVNNLAGQKVYNNNMLVPLDGTLNIELPGLATGMYMVHLRHPNGGSFTSKLIKQ